MDMQTTDLPVQSKLTAVHLWSQSTYMAPNQSSPLRLLVSNQHRASTER